MTYDLVFVLFLLLLIWISQGQDSAKSEKKGLSTTSQGIKWPRVVRLPSLKIFHKEKGWTQSTTHTHNRTIRLTINKVVPLTDTSQFSN